MAPVARQSQPVVRLRAIQANLPVQEI